MRVLVVHRQGNKSTADVAYAVAGLIGGDLEILVDRTDGTTVGWWLDANHREDEPWTRLPNATSKVEDYDVVVVGCDLAEACTGGPVHASARSDRKSTRLNSSH